MRQRSPGTARQQNCLRGGGLGRGAVPQRLPGSSSCHCVTSSKLAIKSSADPTRDGLLCGVHIIKHSIKKFHCLLSHKQSKMNDKRFAAIRKPIRLWGIGAGRCHTGERVCTCWLQSGHTLTFYTDLKRSSCTLIRGSHSPLGNPQSLAGGFPLPPLATYSRRDSSASSGC